ncbi:methylase [Marinobacterium nitratireducens]|uniref:Methylase n=1 Tax=Marinobacterium nitratireducens TaxID=518897 RepID=A0A917ZAS7_9GAMM|nr:DUF938 domain-containing protein [Marinobacterium nitratireducens]GGO77680.1 methylase [Marinobacterium nitratireducens]
MNWTTYSEACARNQRPILERLAPLLANSCRLLEIGSGTGQHAVHFSAAMPALGWQPTDLAANLASLRINLARNGCDNILPPLELDVRTERWPAGPWDAVFSANTLHIVGWSEVEALMAGVGRVLAPGGLLCVYGPFRYGGDYSSPSNAEFDRWLRLRDPHSGIRDFEAVDALARAAGLTLEHDFAMPANNQLLVWRRGAAASSI